jgi:hypothetical protein
MKKLTAYEQALIMTTLDSFSLKFALSSIKKQLPKEKLEEAKKYITKHLIKF